MASRPSGLLYTSVPSLELMEIPNFIEMAELRQFEHEGFDVFSSFLSLCAIIGPTLEGRIIASHDRK